MRKADNLSPSCAVVTKSENLNFLEPSGPVQACNGTDLPFYTIQVALDCKIMYIVSIIEHTSGMPHLNMIHVYHARNIHVQVL